MKALSGPTIASAKQPTLSNEIQKSNLTQYHHKLQHKILILECPAAAWPADIQSSNDCHVCRGELGSPEMWPEPPARPLWTFCNSKLQNVHLLPGQQISRAAMIAMCAEESWAAQKCGQSHQQGPYGHSATASCRMSICCLASRYPEQQ